METRRDLNIGADVARTLFPDGLVEAVDTGRKSRDVGPIGEYGVVCPMIEHY